MKKFVTEWRRFINESVELDHAFKVISTEPKITEELAKDLAVTLAAAPEDDKEYNPRWLLVAREIVARYPQKLQDLLPSMDELSMMLVPLDHIYGKQYNVGEQIKGSATQGRTLYTSDPLSHLRQDDDRVDHTHETTDLGIYQTLETYKINSMMGGSIRRLLPAGWYVWEANRIDYKRKARTGPFSTEELAIKAADLLASRMDQLEPYKVNYASDDDQYEDPYGDGYNDWGDWEDEPAPTVHYANDGWDADEIELHDPDSWENDYEDPPIR